MFPFLYPEWLGEMRFAQMEPRILKALSQEPMTVIGLSRLLKLHTGMIRFTIGQLRKAGHTIENRGSRGGSNSVRGTYHLIKEKV